MIAPAVRPAPPRILVADGDADTRAMYRDCLRVLDGDVIEAADGRSALVSALVHRPSLVITDARLPGFDGYDLCDVLRRDLVTRTIPILVITSESMPSELARARDVGADAVLVKPVTSHSLLKEADRLLKQPPAHPTSPGLPIEPGARRVTANKAHVRAKTVSRPIPPRDLVCPSCDWPLTYEHSYLGGVSAKYSEQWDHYVCDRACGTFEYRV
jgi:two-component system, chemotaxis family, chemotaxis protein CheY